MWTVAATSVCIVLAGMVRVFWVAVPLYIVACVLGGIGSPVRSAWLNACIPSEQRATLISLDSLFGEAGGTAGQLGLGYVSRVASIGTAWVIGGIVQIGSLPFLGLARHRGPASDAGGTCDVTPAV
jgi:sugar phosphate permease